MSNYLRVSILGTLPGGEVWSVNPVWRLGTGDFPLPYEDLITIAAAINTFTVPAGMLAMMNSDTRVSGVRLESRTDDGSLAAVYEAPRSSSVGGTGSAIHPYQTSIVLSLRTALGGASGRGRLYWPATGIALDTSTYRVPVTPQTTFRTAFNSYLSGLTGLISTTNPSSVLVVWSRTTSSSNAVVRTSVGDVLDVQRRRRDALSESVVTGVYP